MVDLKGLRKVELDALADAFRSGKLTLPASSFALQRYVGPARSEAVAAQLAPLGPAGFTDDQAALLLSALANAAPGEGIDPVELVVTGPDAPGVSLRDTSVVVRELFSKAKHEVLVVGYAVYQGRQVFAALSENMDRNPNLKVTLCLDVRRPQGDTSLASDIVLRFEKHFKAKEWPGKRLPDIYFDPRALEADWAAKAALHAKCVVVDAAEAFVSSANFTEAAQVKNVEVGVLLKQSTQARTLSEYFAGLVANGTLAKLA